jgi:hypothetical protein
MQKRRKVAAHDLPLVAAFDEDKRRASVQGLHLAVFRHTSKRIIGVGNPGVVVKHPTRELPKAKVARSQPLHGSLQKIHELLLVIEAVGDMVEDFQVIVQQFRRRRYIDLRLNN